MNWGNAAFEPKCRKKRWFVPSLMLKRNILLLTNVLLTIQNNEHATLKYLTENLIKF